MRLYFPEGFSPNSVEGRFKVDEIYMKIDIVFSRFFDNLSDNTYCVHCTFSGPKAKLCVIQILFCYFLTLLLREAAHSGSGVLAMGREAAVSGSPIYLGQFLLFFKLKHNRIKL